MRRSRGRASVVGDVTGSLVCVYRSRHAELVERLVEQARADGLEVVLWALDEVHPPLAAVTLGAGPGGRLELLNRLVRTTRPAVPLLVADDDISLVQGGLGLLMRRAAQARLSLAQPAHAPGSFLNHRVTAQRSHSHVRRTRFVEVGPLVYVSPAARPLVTPFPEELGMGWGLDVVWSDMTADGHRLGVIDDVAMMHHEPAATAYSRDTARATLAEQLAARGHTNLRAFNRTLAVWPAVSPFPLWIPSRSVLRQVLRRLRGRGVSGR